MSERAGLIGSTDDFAPSMGGADQLVKVKDDVWTYEAYWKPGPGLKATCTMVIVREGTDLTLIGSVRPPQRIVDAILKLGTPKRVVRLNSFHGVRDHYWVKVHNCELWGVRGMRWGPPRTKKEKPISAGTVELSMTHDLQSDIGNLLPSYGTQVFIVGGTLPGTVEAQLLLATNKILITCDMIQAIESPNNSIATVGCLACCLMPLLGFKGEITLTPRPWCGTFLKDNNVNDVKEDIIRLGNLDFDTLITSHGGHVVDGRNKLRAAIVQKFKWSL